MWRDTFTKLFFAKNEGFIGLWLEMKLPRLTVDLCLYFAIDIVNRYTFSEPLSFIAEFVAKEILSKDWNRTFP